MAVQPKEELSHILELIKKELSTDDLYFVGLFGSRARGDYNAGSDYDILFEDSHDFRTKFRGFRRAYRLEEVRERLEKILGKHVDLVNKRTLGTIGSKYILQDLVCV